MFETANFSDISFWIKNIDFPTAIFSIPVIVLEYYNSFQTALYLLVTLKLI